MASEPSATRSSATDPNEEAGFVPRKNGGQRLWFSSRVAVGFHTARHVYLGVQGVMSRIIALAIVGRFRETAVRAAFVKTLKNPKISGRSVSAPRSPALHLLEGFDLSVAVTRQGARLIDRVLPILPRHPDEIRRKFRRPRRAEGRGRRADA